MDIGSVQRMAQNLAASSPVLPPEKLAEHRELIQAVRALNGAELFGQDSELMFQMDRQTQRLVLRVVNRKTKEVIMQVPPEYVLRAAQDLKGK